MDSPQEVKAHAKAIPVKQVLILPLLIGGFVVFADYYAVSPKGSMEILTLRDFVVLPLCAAVPGILIALAYLLFKRTRQTGLKWLFICLVFSVVVVASMRIGVHIRMNAFASLAERSAPLIAAIKAYEQKHGQPPASLDVLVPEYLPAIPNTGMGAYPEYRYMVVADGDQQDGNPWVIIVHTPTGIIDFDEFFYYPLQNYPSQRWGGNGVERVRDWAYMHE